MDTYNMQIACLIIIMYIGGFTKLRQSLVTYTSKLYNCLLINCMIALVFDLICIYCFEHRAVMSPWLFDFLSKLFALSINIFVFLLYTYIICLIEKDTQVISADQWLLITTPFALAVFVISMINFQVNSRTYFMCFLFVGVYIVLIYLRLFIHWKNIHKEHRSLVITIAIIVTLTALHQILMPKILVSGLGICLCVIVIFVKLENPADYMDKQWLVFNEYGLRVVLKDYIMIDIPFNFYVIYIENMEEIYNKYERHIIQSLFDLITERVYITCKLNMFMFSNRTLVMISKENNNYMNRLKTVFETEWFINEKTIKVDAHVYVVKGFSSAEAYLEEILYIQEEFDSKEAYIDSMMEIKNRNAFERDIQYIDKMKDEYKTLYYLVIDVNGLKAVNDRDGHLAGDQLLRNCAEIIRKVERKNITAYRIGGDECCLIIRNRTEKEIEILIDDLRENTRKVNYLKKNPVSFAIGYAKYDKEIDKDLRETIIRADKKMYENKAIMKQKGTTC